MKLLGDIRCLCGGPLRLGDWGGNDQQQLSLTECTVCGRTLAVHIKLEAVPDPPGVLPVGDPRHGTANAYLNLKCRCRRCVEGYSRHRSERRRAGLGAGA